MLRLTITLTCLALMSTWSNAEETPADDKGPELKTTSAQASYGIGLSIGRELQRQGILEIDVDALAQGLRDTFGEAKPRLTQAQISEALQAFEKEMSAKAAEKRKVLSEKNVREGKAFLDANKKKDGVVTLESGLQYKVLKKGEGPSPKKTDRVTTHYHGTFIGGKVFDSSVERNEPATFGVGGVIPGWTEALQLMKVGDKWRLFVPSDLAYGPDGRGDIGPHSVLIFDVELLGIE